MEIEEDELMAKGGFSVRLTILPVGVGQVAVWMGAAPGDAAHIKAEAEKRGLDEYSATIPTLGVPLGPKQKSSQASARMCPAEGDLVSKKWGMYPLLLVMKSLQQLNRFNCSFICRSWMKKPIHPVEAFGGSSAGKAGVD